MILRYRNDLYFNVILLRLAIIHVKRFIRELYIRFSVMKPSTRHSIHLLNLFFVHDTYFWVVNYGIHLPHHRHSSKEQSAHYEKSGPTMNNSNLKSIHNAFNVQQSTTSLPCQNLITYSA